jgi:hypothetical protein
MPEDEKRQPLMKYHLSNVRMVPLRRAGLPTEKTARAHTAPTLAVIFALSILICTCVAESLTASKTLFSAGTVAYTSPSTIVVQVSASHDDAGAWWSWVGYYYSWELEKPHVAVGHFSTGEYYDGGLRFVNVDIPQGATILSAVLKTCAGQTCDGTKARWKIYGQNAGDCNEFSTEADFEARPKTVAEADTGYLSPWVEGSWYETTDISAIIQEIVNNPNWKAGNALAILLHGHPEAQTTHEIRSYDANPSQAAVLEVTYEAG